MQSMACLRGAQPNVVDACVHTVCTVGFAYHRQLATKASAKYVNECLLTKAAKAEVTAALEEQASGRIAAVAQVKQLL